MTSGDFHDLKLAFEGHMLLSYGTDHRRRTEPPDDRTGSPCHLSVPWSTSIWYTRTGPRVIDAVLVNQSDCAVKMLWWRPLAQQLRQKSNKSREAQITVGAAILTALFVTVSKQEHRG